jgi:hypothetical protein
MSIEQKAAFSNSDLQECKGPDDTLVEMNTSSVINRPATSQLNRRAALLALFGGALVGEEVFKQSTNYILRRLVEPPIQSTEKQLWEQFLTKSHEVVENIRSKLFSSGGEPLPTRIPITNEFGSTEVKPSFPSGLELEQNNLMWRLEKHGNISLDGNYVTHTAYGLNEHNGKWQYVTEKAKAIHVSEDFPADTHPHIRFTGRMLINDAEPTIFKIPLREKTDLRTLILRDQHGRKIPQYFSDRLIDGTVAITISPRQGIQYLYPRYCWSAD